MSLSTCLPGLEEEGKISAEQAAEARSLYEERLAAHAAHGSRETAEALASEDVLDALTRQVERKEFLAGLAIQRRAAIEADLRGYGQGPIDPRFRSGGGGGGPIDPKAAAALLDDDPRARYSNVEARRKRIVGDTHRLMDKILTDHSANLRGQVRNKAQLRDIVRELFDGDSGNAAARELAEAWRRGAETLRQRFNRAGGDVGFRSDWGLPQSHNWKAVRAAGFEAWRDFILPKLDPARMVDKRTGLPFTADGLELALRDVFDTIRSNGANTMTPGAKRGGAIADSRAEARFLVFRDAEGWSEYAERFGAGTAYDAMMGHIEMMARDIAAMEILGPDPDATLSWLKDAMVKEASQDADPGSRAISRAKSGARQIDRLWDEYRGRNLEPDNETLALFGSTYRAIATARFLGSATLSAVSDFSFQATRRAFNGLAQRSFLPEYVRLMRPGSTADQQMAIRRGLIAEEYANRTAAQSRFLMEEISGEFARRLASGVLRVSLLSRHTQMMRWVYGMESLSTFTEAAGKGWDELEVPLRGALDRYGIDAAGWDKLRAARMDRDGGVDWISPHNLPAADREIGDRFMEMIHTETDLAVPVADLKTRAVMNNAVERGTVFGELMRSGPLMFRSFGISVLLRQSHQILAMQPAEGAKYGFGLLLATTLMGAAALQLKELSQGRDPRPMNDDKFALAAIQQGGGFGIFGDLLFSLESRTGNGMGMTAAGVLPQDFDKLARAVANLEKNAVRTARNWVPGNNLWYARLAIDRMIADQAEEAINSDVAAARRRLHRYAEEKGTRFWWSPGAAAPKRAPDLANALEEGPAER